MDSISCNKECEVSCAKSSRKVGIVCHSMESHVAKVYELKIYLLDIDQQCGTSDYALSTPAVKFIFPSSDSDSLYAVCVLNSTVYLFGGSLYGTYHLNLRYAKKYVFTEEKKHEKVTPEHLTGVSLMKHSKIMPEAIATPDGKKILVFSSNIILKESSKAFELFDPMTEEWEELPELPWECSRHKDRDVCECNSMVKAYSFIDDSLFFVELIEGGISFIFDLVEKEWFTADVPPLPATVEGQFVIAEARYALYAGEVHDLSNGGFLGDGDLELVKVFYGHPFPLSTFEPPNTPDWLKDSDWPSIVPLEQGVGVCNTCVLQIETRDGLEARLLVDACQTDLNTLETRVFKSVRLLVDFLECLVSIDLISVT